ncbi:nickel ABC transporter substrate-binding protein [Dickeya dianthicola]|uniref:nickel ABC transporter substrate-binding protein n=1 Tax=Dickeya dianthicola TaxID=204039 RepID=UPI00047A064C|nr:nickel ABC transporter substrate-binding protein [Dickeya dianthicola]ATO32575.1 Nickel ABC transporter, periplasmi nickel-binding protein NikA [Dickeya dianthicola RNS04.9]MBT1431736.1 nickel ABC transporter substrate-binding protein [Dickeya dianthicola]MCA7003114.1 nickel ABC transporter substrate-binding protein [Dickeya dianthicola]MCI4154954.1 nickel ABC transporter substrate-binding protein [Dickeya dianthicola]
MCRIHPITRAALILCLLFGAFSVAAGTHDSELVYASTKDIRDINPHLYAGEMAAQNMVFEPLVINTPDGVKPWLAASWTISPDGKRYIFTLRRDVRFSDGEPLTADVVKQNIEAVLDNYQRHAWLELVRQIDNVTALDRYRVQITLKNPYYPTLIELGLTRPFRFVSLKAFIGGKTKDGITGYVGTGPWLLAEHKPNQYARFVANPDYWGTRPRLDGVVWRVMPDRQSMLMALQKETVQLIFGADGDMLDMDSFTALEVAGNYPTLISPPVASRALVLNSARPITGDKAVRQALQYAIDKAAIAAGIMGNSESVADTLMSRRVPYCDIDLPVYRFNPPLTGTLLEAAGWHLAAGKTVREKQGKALALMLSYNRNNAAEREIAELIQDDLKRVGVQLTILGEEKQAFLDRQKSGDFDLQYSLSWGTPYDPASYISSFRIPAHADYQAQKALRRKPDIDNLIGEILLTPNEKQRQERYTRLFTLLADEAVYIPLTYSKTKAIYLSRLKGVSFNASQYEIPFEKMHF